MSSSAAVSPSSSTSSLLSSSSSLSNSPETCFVCDCPIVERSQTSDGDNAIFCDGPHQQWAHASCVGVSDEHYYSLSSSREPWFCPSCSEIPQEGAKPEGVKSPPLSATITSSDLSRCPVPLPASKCVPLSTSKGESPESSPALLTPLLAALRTAQAERVELVLAVESLSRRISVLEARLEPTSRPQKSKRTSKQRRATPYSLTATSPPPTLRESPTAPTSPPLSSDSPAPPPPPSPAACDEALVLPNVRLTNRFSLLASKEITTDVTPPPPPPPPKQPLWKNPKIKFIWGTTRATTEAELSAHIVDLGVDSESFQVERRRSTRGRKKVWFFAVIAESQTIQKISSKWLANPLPRSSKWSLRDPDVPHRRSSFLSQPPCSQNLLTHPSLSTVPFSPLPPVHPLLANPGTSVPPLLLSSPVPLFSLLLSFPHLSPPLPLTPSPISSTYSNNSSPLSSPTQPTQSTKSSISMPAVSSPKSTNSISSASLTLLTLYV